MQRQQDVPAMKTRMNHRQGEFTAGDSFWFFPALDPDESATRASS
jgi:hypothetical protein